MAQEKNNPAIAPHNIIIFVADGLRYGMVTPQNAPTLAAVKNQGVDFQNSHSLYPTITTVNASAIATGHGIGDTGEFANNMYAGDIPITSSKGVIGDMEDEAVLNDINNLYGGNYLNEQSLISLAASKGFNTAIIGKEGPTLIQNINSKKTAETLIFSDATGIKGKPQLTMSSKYYKAFKDAGIELTAPSRGENGGHGDMNIPGTKVANINQQQWFTDVTNKIILPQFKDDKKPFVMLYWSRDPDGTQHNEGDSLNQIDPGINGETSLKAIRNASDNLQSIIDTLKKLGLYDSTDIFVTADHGFTTISKQSNTSESTKYNYPDVPKRFLPPGFVAIDIAKALKLPLYKTNGELIDAQSGSHPNGASILAKDGKTALAYIVALGGSDMIYLTENGKKDAPNLIKQIIGTIKNQDYTWGIFVDEQYGSFDGALKMSDVGLSGSAITPKPAIYISFTAKSLNCTNPELCVVSIADTSLQQGQGIHGSLSRGETRNFMAAIGPDFKSKFVNKTPISNADIAPTLAKIIGLELPAKGNLKGRVIDEALKGHDPVYGVKPITLKATPLDNGFATTLHYQELTTKDGKKYRYYDYLEAK